MEEKFTCLIAILGAIGIETALILLGRFIIKINHDENNN